jgi:hypothetical protein
MCTEKNVILRVEIHTGLKMKAVVFWVVTFNQIKILDKRTAYIFRTLQYHDMQAASFPKVLVFTDYTLPLKKKQSSSVTDWQCFRIK